MPDNVGSHNAVEHQVDGLPQKVLTTELHQGARALPYSEEDNGT
jgi:hypothetical protein